MDNKIIETGESLYFNSEIVKQRGLIRAKYLNWEESRNGLITYAGKEILKCLFLTDVNVSATYFMIRVSEVKAGLWDITITPDLETFYKIESGTAEEEIDLPAAVRNLFEEATDDGDNESGTDTGNGGL